MSKLQSKRLIRTMKAPVKLSLGGGSMGSHAFSGRAPIRKPCRDDIIRQDVVRKIHDDLHPTFKQMSFLGSKARSQIKIQNKISIIYRRHSVALKSNNTKQKCIMGLV